MQGNPTGFNCRGILGSSKISDIRESRGIRQVSTVEESSAVQKTGKSPMTSDRFEMKHSTARIHNL